MLHTFLVIIRLVLAFVAGYLGIAFLTRGEEFEYLSVLTVNTDGFAGWVLIGISVLMFISLFITRKKDNSLKTKI